MSQELFKPEVLDSSGEWDSAIEGEVREKVEDQVLVSKLTCNLGRVQEL